MRDGAHAEGDGIDRDAAPFLRDAAPFLHRDLSTPCLTAIAKAGAGRA